MGQDLLSDQVQNPPLNTVARQSPGSLHYCTVKYSLKSSRSAFVPWKVQISACESDIGDEIYY